MSADVETSVRGRSIQKVIFYSSFKHTTAVLSPVISDDSRNVLIKAQQVISAFSFHCCIPPPVSAAVKYQCILLTHAQEA
jgi:hypothetical protein